MQYSDVIVYIPNLIKFRDEVKQKAFSGAQGFDFDEAGNVIYNVSKIPVVYNGLKSVCVIRLFTDTEIDTFNSLTTCEKIGDCKNGNYEFEVNGREKYDSVRSTAPIKIIYKNGDEIDYFQSELIGVLI